MPAERPEDFVLRVTRRIAEVRRARDITQDQLAEALGTATRNVQRLEAGQNLTLYTLSRVAAALGVAPEDLVASRPRPRRYAAAPGATAVLSEKTGAAKARRVPGGRAGERRTSRSSDGSVVRPLRGS